MFETQLPPVGKPLLPLLPASNGSPLEPLLDPPRPPKRSRQQCVAGLQVESHGAPAWISDIFAMIFVKSFAQVHAGADEPPLEPPLEVVEPELEVEPLDEVEPPELEVLPPLDVDPPAGLLGGSVWELSVLVPLLALLGVPSGISSADSAHAKTSAEARNAEAARRWSVDSFMAGEFCLENGRETSAVLTEERICK